MSATPEQQRIAKQLIRQLRQMSTIAKDEGLFMPQEGNHVHEVLDSLANAIVSDIICDETVPA